MICYLFWVIIIASQMHLLCVKHCSYTSDELTTYIEPLLKKLVTNGADAAALSSEYRCWEIPEWMPFKSFSFGKYLFFNKALRQEKESYMRAAVGHEVWHAYHNHTIKMLLSGILLGTVSYAAWRLIQHRIPRALKAVVAILYGYAVYAAFHRISVKQLELEADCGNAYTFDNYNEVMRELYAQQDIPYAWNDTWQSLLFTLIAPCHPSPRETLDYIGAHAPGVLCNSFEKTC